MAKQEAMQRWAKLVDGSQESPREAQVVVTFPVGSSGIVSVMSGKSGGMAIVA